MEDSIIVWRIKIDNFTQWILPDHHSTWFRVEICKFFWEIYCRDSYVSETGGAPWFQTCRIWNQLALTLLKDFHTYNGKVFGFLHKNNNFWELSTTLSKNFYQNLNIQECFPSNDQEIEKIPDDFWKEIYTHSFREDVELLVYDAEKDNFWNYFYVIILSFVIFIFISIKFYQKLRNKSP